MPFLLQGYILPRRTPQECVSNLGEEKESMKPLHDVNSAARLLSISPWTVRSYIHEGKLSAVRIGRRVLVEEIELERFVKEGKAGRCTPPPVGLPGGVL